MLSFMLPHAGPVWGNMMEELWALNSIFSHYFLIELYISKISIELGTHSEKNYG